MTTNILLTFLGRAPRQEGRYRTTRYRYLGELGEPTAFFGYWLQRRFRPERLIVLGTQGSMWDHLFESDLALGNEQEALREQLIEAVEQKAVSQKLLDELTPLLASALGCDVVLAIVPAAAAEPEQLAILQRIASLVGEHGSLSLDITHAMRHLPVIGFLSLLYLQAVRPGVSVDHIWYGEYNQDTREGHVRDLKGLLTVNRWISAIQRSEIQGDFSAISELMEDHPAAPCLAEASFLENIHRHAEARRPLKKARELLTSHPLEGPASLFEPALQERIAWIDAERLYQRQAAQAFHALERGDYLRATLYGFEAYITRKAQESDAVSPGRESHYEERQLLRESLEKQQSFRKSPEGQAYLQLRNLRNALAHGNVQKVQELQQVLSNRQTLETALQSHLDTLLGDARP